MLTLSPRRRAPLSLVGLCTLGLTAATPLAAQGSNPPTGQDDRAVYEVRFDSTWSAATHPTAFPSFPHYSPFVGAAHDDQVQFWGPGQLASLGVRNVAETGSTTRMHNELAAAASAGHAGPAFQFGGIGSPAVGTFRVNVNAGHSLLTFLTMLAPSPDWFCGVHDLDLQPNGRWIDQVTLPLDVYDAGTDGGAFYSSRNLRLSPARPIGLVTTASGAFQNLPTTIGTISIERIASVQDYGSGIAPRSSLTADREPRLGSTTNLRIHDPSGTIAEPAVTVLGVATSPAIDLASGFLVSGTGLGTPNGELLLGSGAFTVPGPGWNGTPALLPVPIPVDSNLIGMKIYLQGAMSTPAGTPRLTTALELFIGD